MYMSAYLQRASLENYITIETPFSRCFLFKSGQYYYFNYPTYWCWKCVLDRVVSDLLWA